MQNYRRIRAADLTEVRPGDWLILTEGWTYYMFRVFSVAENMSSGLLYPPGLSGGPLKKRIALVRDGQLYFCQPKPGRRTLRIDERLLPDVVTSLRLVRLATCVRCDTATRIFGHWCRQHTCADKRCIRHVRPTFRHCDQHLIDALIESQYIPAVAAGHADGYYKTFFKRMIRHLQKAIREKPTPP